MPLSKKIQEFHEAGFVEDLIDVHFADSLCYKQRIKQEDSRLVVQHHAGSFVMLCVGIFVGVMILFLEHAIFRWVVPGLRQKPNSSKWKSVHLMFFSQVLQLGSGQFCCGSGEKGFTLYLHCLSSRVRIGDKREVGRS